MAASCGTQVLLGTAICPSMRQDSLCISSAASFGRRIELVQSCKQVVATGHPTRAAELRPWTVICDGSSTASSSISGPAMTEDKLNKLEGIKLCDRSGATVSLVGLWESRPAVVAFSRHFGCILCRKRAALLESRKAEMDAAGVAVVLIAPGSPEQARKFVEATKFSGEVYADPDHACYDAFEFIKGVNSVVNFKSGSRLVQAHIEGYRQDWKLSFYKDTVQRGGWLQGGILVAGPGASTIRYLFKDAEAGDEPELEDVISACCSIESISP